VAAVLPGEVKKPKTSSISRQPLRHCRRLTRPPINSYHQLGVGYGEFVPPSIPCPATGRSPWKRSPRARSRSRPSRNRCWAVGGFSSPSPGSSRLQVAYLACRLVESGADVRVISPSPPVSSSGLRPSPPSLAHHPSPSCSRDSVSPHTELARWADVTVVARPPPPWRARHRNVKPGLGHTSGLDGSCSDRTRHAIEMWLHPATQRNVKTLTADGYHSSDRKPGPRAANRDGASG
jgi:hypothetical protein